MHLVRKSAFSWYSIQALMRAYEVRGTLVTIQFKSLLFSCVPSKCVNVKVRRNLILRFSSYDET
jgi:hypothetical protein